MEYASFMTNQIDRMKVVFDSLKDIGIEELMIFRENEVQLIGIDRAQVMDVRFTLSVDKLQKTGGCYEFTCPPTKTEVLAGMPSKQMSRIVKRATTDDILKIAVTPGATHEIIVSCISQSKTFTSKVRGLDINEIMKSASAPNAEYFQYSCTVHMQSLMLDRIIGDLATSDPECISITYDGNCIKLKADGAFSDSEVVLTNTKPANFDPLVTSSSSSSALNTCKIEDKSTPQQIRGLYSVDYLRRIANAKNMSCKLNMYLGQNSPAMFSFDSPIGDLSFMIAPRMENNDWEESAPDNEMTVDEDESFF